MDQMVTGGINSLLEKLNLKSADAEAAPREPSGEQVKLLREKFARAGQEQVFTFYDDLTVEEMAGLVDQLQTINPDRINVLADKAIHPPKPSEGSKEPTIEPLPKDASVSLLNMDPKETDEWHQTGLKLISENKVALLLMAGGQGTRLGSSEPKGCFDIGLPSKKSLFQVQAERILKIQQLAQKLSDSRDAVSVPWYVMTSGPTRIPTQEFFDKNNYFGLSKDNVIIFDQGCTSMHFQ